MKNIPRILPLVGVAMGGVLAINALAGARGLPDLMSGAKAFAEEAAKGAKAEKGKDDEKAETGAGKDAAAAVPSLTPTITPKPVCAPTAAELAKEAGLSPAELQVLQSLGERRGQLDQREDDLNTQLALMAAAEAKLDAKVKALNGLKGDIQGLLTQADAMEAAEIDRLVKVFEGMKAKDAAPRFMLLDDNVRLPIAAKMKERALSGILAQMPPAEAKKLSEGMAKRFIEAKRIAANATAAADQAATQTPGPQAAAPAKAEKAGPTEKADAAPAKAAPAKAAPAKRAPPKQARNTPKAKPQPKADAPQAQAAATPPAPVTSQQPPGVPPAAAPTPTIG